VHTLLVCETEPIAIEGLRNLLASLDGFRLIAAEAFLPDALQAFRELAPSLVLVDKAFGVQPVIEFLNALRGSHRAASIVWGGSLTEVEALRFFQSGAAGVLRKTATPQTIVQCLRTIASGGTWMEHDESNRARRASATTRSMLTVREVQVRELVERGMKNKDIAVALGIRTGTVKIHLKHIFEKTGIRGRYGLALSGLHEKGLLVGSGFQNAAGFPAGAPALTTFNPVLNPKSA